MNGFRIVWVMAVAALCGGCGKSAAPAAAPPTAPSGALFMPTQAQPKLRTIKLWLGAEEMEAEMALTPQQQATGMMFRTNRLAENAGMLFPRPYTEVASFWMTNCPLPLAAAYIDPEGVIQEIHAFHANDNRTVVSATANIRFVLETSEGWFQRHNITTGTVVRTESGTLMDTFFRKGQRPGR
jgi:uncharacterized protein